MSSYSELLSVSLSLVLTCTQISSVVFPLLPTTTDPEYFHYLDRWKTSTPPSPLGADNRNMAAPSLISRQDSEGTGYLLPSPASITPLRSTDRPTAVSHPVL